jgi:hypothetical protein
VLTLHNPQVRLRSVTGEWTEAVRGLRPETGGEVVVRLRTAFDPGVKLVRGIQRIEERDGSGVLARTTDLPLAFSLTGKEDFRRLAHDAGLGVESLAGDFEGRPFRDADSPMMVWTLVRERGGWRSPPTRSSKGVAPEDEEGALAYDVGSTLSGKPTTPPPATTDVHLAVSTRRSVAADSDLVVRFAAYTESFRPRVTEIFRKEAPRDEPLLDLEACQWQIGTEVTVTLAARGLEVENGRQSFVWDGKYKVLRFDVVVPAGRDPGTVVLKLDVHVAGLVVASLRPEIEIVAGAADNTETTTALRFPRSAFASYATADSKDVMKRIRSVQIATGIDVFFARLSIVPGEDWEERLRAEISRREIFWLFWSTQALKSEWVDREWRTALAEKTLKGIQPHPLEPESVAPAPPELAALQFGNLYETLLSLDDL